MSKLSPQPRRTPSFPLPWREGASRLLACASEDAARLTAGIAPRDTVVCHVPEGIEPGSLAEHARYVRQLVLAADHDRDAIHRLDAEAAQLDGTVDVRALSLAPGETLAGRLTDTDSPGDVLAELLDASPAGELPPDRSGDTATAAPAGRRVELTPASAIRSERVRWLDPGRVPIGGLTVVAGEKGLGKSTLTNAYWPARVTRGELDGELSGTPADALVLTGEDSWGAVVKPRLMAHGADLDRVHRVEALDGDGQVTFTLPDDLALVEAEIAALAARGRRIAYLAVDPIGAFLTERTDSHKDAHVRRALAPMAAMAERWDLALPVVAHLSKDDSRRLISRVSGSGAFVNAARSVLGFARDPGDPNGEQGHERALVHVASNWGRYAPSLGMRVEGREVQVDDGSTAEVGYLVITGEIDLGVEDLQRGADEHGTDTEEEIGARLADGPRPSREVKAEIAAELGCARKTVERAGARMADRGDLTIESGGFPRTTTWALPSGDTAVGTTRDTVRVPTEEPRMNRGDSESSRDSRDSRDSSPARVPTGAGNGHPDQAAAATAERIRERTRLRRCSCVPVADGGLGPDGEPGERCERCVGAIPAGVAT